MSDTPLTQKQILSFPTIAQEPQKRIRGYGKITADVYISANGDVNVNVTIKKKHENACMKIKLMKTCTQIKLMKTLMKMHIK